MLQEQGKLLAYHTGILTRNSTSLVPQCYQQHRSAITCLVLHMKRLRDSGADNLATGCNLRIGSTNATCFASSATFWISKIGSFTITLIAPSPESRDADTSRRSPELAAQVCCLDGRCIVDRTGCARSFLRAQALHRGQGAAP